MRKTRGLLFILIGIILALGAAYMVVNISRQAAAQARVQPTPVPKVYVVTAKKDIAENVAISSDDLTRQELPAALAPPGAIASSDIAVGKYTTAPIYKGEILVAPLLADTKKSSALAAEIPDGKVAMAVTVNGALNSLGVLRPGDHVDILLTLDLKDIVPQSANGSKNAQELPDEKSTQLTMQNVEILSIGAPAGSSPSYNSEQGRSLTSAPTPAPAPVASQTQAQSRTIVFLLDRQDAVTLKFIKDSGGIMDLVLRSPTDNKVAETKAETLDSIYREFHFRFAQPVKP